MKAIKLLPTLFSKYIIKMAYSIFCLFFKVDEKKVTFASSRSKKMDGNLYYVWKEFNKREPDYQYIESFYKIDNSIKGKFAYFFHILKDSYHLATSKYFIIDDYHFSVYVIHPRQGTEIIQLWHACGAFKKFGMSTLGKSFAPSQEYLQIVKIHSNYSRVYVSSSEVTPFYAEAFDMNAENIYPLGVPRTDYFFESTNKEILLKKLTDLFPAAANKRLILYAPTFRGKSHQQDGFISPIDFKLLKDSLAKDTVFLVHLHPYMSSSFQIDEAAADFVIHITEEFNIQEMLILADVLITDYSSIIFDYSLLNKPAAFFAHDLAEYVEERDFYYDYEKFVPGPIFTNTEELSRWLELADYNLAEITAFQKRFFEYTDGKASERIVSHLLNQRIPGSY